MLIIWNIFIFCALIGIIMFIHKKYNKSLLKSSFYGFGIWIIFTSILLYVGSSIQYACMSDSEKYQKHIQDSIKLAKEDSIMKVEKQKEMEYHKINRIESCAVVFLKSNLDSPDSYKEVDVNVFEKDSLTNIYGVYIKYRAKNRFNAEILTENTIYVLYENGKAIVIGAE